MAKYPFQPIEFLAKYGSNSNMDEMKNDLDQAIASAVAAEREACAKVAEDAPLAFYDTQARRDIAAAIRRRK